MRRRRSFWKNIYPRLKPGLPKSVVLRHRARSTFYLALGVILLPVLIAYDVKMDYDIKRGKWQP